MSDQPPVSPWREAARRFLDDRLAIVGLILVGLVTLAAVIGPLVIPYSFQAQDFAARGAGPSAAHWLGTDDLGRDVAARVVHGARTALVLGVAVTAVSAAIGVALGALAGYRRGRIDAAILWLTDVTMTVPSLLLVVAINASLLPALSRWMEAMYFATGNVAFRDEASARLVLVFGTIALVKWPQYARLARSQVLAVSAADYVLAARALGLPAGVILRRYVLPNSLGPIIVAMSFGLGTAMVLESAFSFLGIGVQPPTPSWGRMIAEGLRQWSGHPHLLVVPAAALALTATGFAFVGDGLNAALNPKSAL